MPWADGTKCAEGMVRLTLSHCLIKVSVSVSLSPSLSRSLSLPRKRNPSNPTLFLSVSTTTPNLYPQPLDPFVHVDRLSKNGETLHRYMNNISSHQVWFLILKSFYCSYFFSNLWHILSLIYRIKGKFKKHLCTFNYLSFYRHS